MKNNTVTKVSDFLGEQYEIVRHHSGLEIYVFPKQLSTTYALFATRYGSIDNRFKVKGDEEFTVVPDGIAHYLEHKMFENEDGTDTFERYAKTGADANAYTSFDRTAYLFSCTDKVYESLEILLDFVTHPYFTPETVAKEQGIIGQEIRMGEDNPGRALIFDMLQSLYEKNPVRIEVAGTVESIAKIDAPLLYRCYNTFYNLHNMALIVCGNVTVDGVLAVADKVLKDQEDPGIVRETEPEPAGVVRSTFRRRMRVAKPLFAIGFKNPEPIRDPRERLKYATALSIGMNILFGTSGEFFSTLYKEGLISGSLDCWSEHVVSHSFSCISGESDDPDEVRARILAHAAAAEIGEEDFRRNKKIDYSRYIKSFDSTEEIASALLDSVFDGTELFEYPEILESIDLPYVVQVVRTALAEDRCAMAVVEPVEDGGEAE